MVIWNTKCLLLYPLTPTWFPEKPVGISNNQIFSKNQNGFPSNQVIFHKINFNPNFFVCKHPFRINFMVICIYKVSKLESCRWWTYTYFCRIFSKWQSHKSLDAYRYTIRFVPVNHQYRKAGSFFSFRGICDSSSD